MEYTTKQSVSDRHTAKKVWVDSASVVSFGAGVFNGVPVMGDVNSGVGMVAWDWGAGYGVWLRGLSPFGDRPLGQTLFGRGDQAGVAAGGGGVYAQVPLDHVALVQFVLGDDR